MTNGKDRIDALFGDGYAAKPVPLPPAQRDEDRFIENASLLPDVRPAFSPGGGYGLFVHQGAAAFRNARVTRLDP